MALRMLLIEIGKNNFNLNIFQREQGYEEIDEGNIAEKILSPVYTIINSKDPSAFPYS
jgi:hypothetical protein